ncbi:MAG: HAD-IA family hydrolase [Dehalococcoidia bacterium]|nr:HAD-IA family hydrolase [Dehalococcoidia bacterium]
MPKLDFKLGDSNLCFACGQDNPIGLKLKPVYDGKKVRAQFTPGEFHQGWENITHGGILYTLLDEVTAYAILCNGIDFGVTTRSQVSFRHVAPIGKPIQISAWVTKLTKRLVETSGVLTLEDSTTILEGNSIFYIWRWSKKAVIWDMNGVIADTNKFHIAAWQETFAKRKLKPAKEELTRLFGARNDIVARKFLGEGLSEEDIKAIGQEKEANFQEKIKGNIKTLPGVIELLDTLKKGKFKLALASSAPRKTIDLVNTELNTGQYFDYIISGQEAVKNKPAPQVYLLAAEKLGARPEDCIVIEDSPFGIEAAKAAGMRCLAITNSYPEESLRKADRVASSLEDIDLIALLQRV